MVTRRPPPPPPPTRGPPNANVMLSMADVVVVSMSGGKDSQVMLAEVMRRRRPGCRVVAVTADLGRMEWEVQEHLQMLTAHYGVELHTVKPVRTLLASIRRRGKWPSMGQRYCTSDHKRGPIAKWIRNNTSGLVVHCTGERREESPRRRKLAALELEAWLCAPTKGRVVWRWRPVIDWTLAEVWASIEASGLPAHWVYAEGMSRLSCVFCVFAAKSDLLTAKRLRPELYDELVILEQDMDHTFRHKFPLGSLADNPDDGRTGPS